MLSALRNALLVNRGSLDRYLGSEAFRRVEYIINSLNPLANRDDPSLLEKFRSHVISEEIRLSDNLRKFGYEIDAPDTLALVAGPGRIEKVIPVGLHRAMLF